MNQLVEIDKTNFTMTVEAGMVLENIHLAAEQQDLFFPLSLGAQGSCQIGGNIATNAGGLSVLKYGNTRDLVLGLEVVLPNGQILNDLSKLRKNNTGYNLTQLFTGAEGSLGIITQAVLKLFPLPKYRQCLLLAFETIENLTNFYQLSRQQSADCISSFEYISDKSLELVKNGPVDCTIPLEQKYKHYALVEFSSSSDFLELDTIVEKILNQALEQKIVLDGSMAQSESQRMSLWKIRESIPQTERLLGGSIKHDISLPISHIADFLNQLPKALEKVSNQHRYSVYGHIGDGNLHFNLLQLEGEDAEVFKQQYEKKLSNVIYHLAKKLDGSFSAEHGIGQLKLDQLKQYKDPVALKLMRKIKRAVDKKNRMNPGKLVNLINK